MTDALHESFGYWVSRLARSMRDAVDAEFAEHGLNVAHWAILATCEDRPMRVVDVARRVGVDAAGITRLIEKLSVAGLVARDPDLEDGRAQRISLTDAGRSLLPELKAISLRHNRWWIDALGGVDAAEWIRRIEAAVQQSDEIAKSGAKAPFGNRR